MLAIKSYYPDEQSRSLSANFTASLSRKYHASFEVVDETCVLLTEASCQSAIANSLQTFVLRGFHFSDRSGVAL